MGYYGGDSLMGTGSTAPREMDGKEKQSYTPPSMEIILQGYGRRQTDPSIRPFEL